MRTLQRITHTTVVTERELLEKQNKLLRMALMDVQHILKTHSDPLHAVKHVVDSALSVVNSIKKGPLPASHSDRPRRS